MQQLCSTTWTYKPVESIAHLYGDKYGKSHCHWIGRLKNHTVNTEEVWIVLFALQKMALEQKNGNSLSHLIDLSHEINVCNLLFFYSHFNNQYEKKHVPPPSPPPQDIKLSKYQLVEGNSWTTISSNKPPSSSTHCGSTNITFKKAKCFYQYCELCERQDLLCHT